MSHLPLTQLNQDINFAPGSGRIVSILIQPTLATGGNLLQFLGQQGGDGTVAAAGGIGGTIIIQPGQGGSPAFGSSFPGGAGGGLDLRSGLARSGTPIADATAGGNITIAPAGGGNSGGSGFLAGLGGQFNATSGQGGAGEGTSPGRAGGALRLTAGRGGTGGTLAGGIGAKGGDLVFTSGAAGTNTGFGSSFGGDLDIISGAGAAGSGSSPGSSAGIMLIQGGTGGAGTATAAAGGGGSIQLLGGNAGTDAGGGAGAGGSITIDSGSATTGSSNVTIGGTNAKNIRIGRIGQLIGFFGNAGVVQQTSGANLTNNVTAGGTTDQVDNFTDLIVYANDAAAIRNAIYQLSRKLKQVNDGLRAYGLLT